MKTSVKLFTILLYISLLAGCVSYESHPPARQPFISQAIWSQQTKTKVYTTCLTALHMQGFNIHPLGTSQESGLIIVGATDVLSNPNLNCSYSLQILISELPDNKVVVDINPKGLFQPLNSVVHYKGNDELFFKNCVNNKIARDMATFFAQMDVFLGKAESHSSGNFLEWK